jgi:hypothetical protein
MKTKILSLLIVALLMTSCTSYFYQVYQVAPSSDIKTKNGLLVYEDNNCQISYNFWGEKGNIGFNFYNKSENDLYLNLSESYFIMNGVAYDYYKDRTFTSEGGSAIYRTTYYGLIGATSTTKTSVAQKEKAIIGIPPKASKNISEYLITNDILRTCDLFVMPQKKNIKTVTYTKENSPLIFSNRLVYFIEGALKPMMFSNEFFVSELTNYPEDEITELKAEEFCDEKSTSKIRTIKDVSPTKFYVKYSSTSLSDYYDH